jgi:hypothetical protein
MDIGLNIKRVLIVLFSAAWVKLAVDLVFFFGPESARAWFGLRAVIALVSFSAIMVILNTVFLVKISRGPTGTLNTLSRVTLVLAFLSSIFSCWATETNVKFLQIYIVIPVIIALLVALPHAAIGRLKSSAFLLLAVILLWPSDKCVNPANWWWLNTLGASPLAYLLPVNVLVLLAGGHKGSFSRLFVPAVVVVYYTGSLFHRFVEGY